MCMAKKMRKNIKTVENNKKSNKYKTTSTTTTNTRREQNKYVCMQKKNERITYIVERRVPLSPHKYFYVVSFFCFRLMIKCLVFRLNISQKYTLHMLQIDMRQERDRGVRFLLFLSLCVYLNVSLFILVDKFTATTVITVQLSHTGCFCSCCCSSYCQFKYTCIHKCGNKKYVSTFFDRFHSLFHPL